MIPVVLTIASTSVYAVSHTGFDLLLLAIFGTIGFLLVKTGFPVVGVVLGMVLGPILEINFRNALVANNMDLTIFITRPLNAVLLLILVILILLSRGRRAWNKVR